MMLMSRFGRGFWEPFGDISQMQSDMNRLINGFGGTSRADVYPRVNIWLGEDSAAVTARMPGLAHEDIGLTVTDDTLTIRGERPYPSNDNELSWHKRERVRGTFSRTIELPFRVDPQRVEARFTNGVLEIELRRPEEDMPRKIEVKAA